ncbi:seryl-tRNA synthetase [Caulobacter ginsengisoli]|uniref:Serine--tRNA ligase n=1 Tax=Caulobacter ginsengisoli TaxID=400775 RepID=A0ABU0IP71_9CAUL|nr:serine--tRNA ligase [Caulobacter ginsengisoli]MDQ0463811.1 seryl-tRNA synthetase [Caulobacter ginsengisoli]
MHDIRAIRDNPTVYDAGWSSRGLSSQTPAILELDAILRAAQTALQAAQSRRNEASKQIGAAKAKKDEAAAQALMAEVEALKAEMATQAEIETSVGATLRGLLASLPNLPDPVVPAGADEHDNVEQRRHGEPRKTNNPRDHVDLGAALGGMDFEAAARMSGSRFVVLKGGIARLERAIGQFMIDHQTTVNGYTEISPPLLVKDEAMFGTGQLPKFYDDQFSAARMSERERLLRKALYGLKDELKSLPAATDPLEAVFNLIDRAPTEEDLWLIPTAEVSLTNLVREQITDEAELPLRLTALTASFRAEAGASGRDTRGMIRQHQFYKVELVSITTPEQSDAEHERMTNAAESVLKALDLPFRTMLLCTGDMGFSARRTYDLEVWLPSQNGYREISSCSNCGDFQARRMDARCKVAGEKGTRFVHTLNGSGLAVGRTLVAVMENYQDEGGRIAIPDALKPYMGGLDHIG